jgi:hypothetical protein
MADPHVITGLMEKRAQLAGELQAVKRRAVQIRISLLHVDFCLRMLKDGYEPKSIRPKPPRKDNPAGLRKGVGSRTALEVLRDCAEPLDSNELARRVLERLGKQITPEAIRMLGVTLQANFSRHRKHIVGFDRSTYPGRWYLLAEQ